MGEEGMIELALPILHRYHRGRDIKQGGKDRIVMPCVCVETQTISSGLLSLFSGDGKRLVVVIEAFIDESGTHKGSPLVAVGAVIGAHWQWRKFLSMWDDKPFHAKERKYDPLKPALFDAFQECELEGFVASMIPDDYEKHANKHFRSGLGNPYSVCTFACAVGVSKYCKDNNLGEIAFVIEAGQPNVNFVRETLEYMQTKERYRIASVAVAPKEKFVQLCTADFLSHSRTSEPEWFSNLHATNHVWIDEIGPEKIVRMSKQISTGIWRMRKERQKLKKDLGPRK